MIEFITDKIWYILIVYLWASIPYGYILTKLSTGKNIMEHGSGNIGSTNVKRIAGRNISIATQLLDMLKGLLPIVLLKTNTSFLNSNTLFVYIVAITCIIGHDFSIFLKFKGGKGVNTTLGASVLIAPYSVFLSVASYYIVKWKFKYVSLGSIVLAITLPISELIINGLSTNFYYLLICAALIILRHHENIKRLVTGKELLK